MNDTFAEQLVKKPKSSSDTVKKVLIITCAGIILAVISILCTFSFLAVIPAGFVGVAVYSLMTGMNVEYEYAVTNGSLDIDKIIAQRKRKSMVSVDVKDFTAFGKYENAGDFSGTTVLAAGGEEEPFYAEFKTEPYGEVRLVFSPDERVLGCIKPYLTGNLKNYK